MADGRRYSLHLSPINRRGNERGEFDVERKRGPQGAELAQQEG
jgi:hypothetical protein